MVIGSTLCEGCNCCTDQGIAGCKEWHAADVLLVIGTRVKQGQVVHCVASKKLKLMIGHPGVVSYCRP
jgi:hypothetical protein